MAASVVILPYSEIRTGGLKEKLIPDLLIASAVIENCLQVKTISRAVSTEKKVIT